MVIYPGMSMHIKKVTQDARGIPIV